MSFNRPSIGALIERIAADFESRLPGTNARLRRSNLSVFARVLAGVAHGLYGFIDFIARQVIIDTADTTYLERWGAIWGITRLPAAASTGDVRFSAVSGLAIPVAAGTLLQRADGVQYETTAIGTYNGANTIIAPVRALVPGLDGDAALNTELMLAADILGVNATVVVDVGFLSSGVVGGRDVESDDALRTRLLTRIRLPPHGGAAHDYLAWALEVPGVTRAWVYPLLNGAGTVGLYFVRDNDATTIIPDAAEINAVDAYIQARRPVTADVTIYAPSVVLVNFTLQPTPDTAEVRSAIAAELADLFRRESQPGGTILISHLREAVSRAAGEHDHFMSAPTADIVGAAGQMPTLGEIAWGSLG